ncbi:hypothetical protein TNIN_428341 [Trichonephila inaurata madagascariensis]|uniref:Uncharacterized protein n=1 Tax=Trichonephila inaurata madagascariensis TaxID=2747483 RepID=A0A8X7CAH7_9ARAC|nr:hypothetical protein TNIN_428341 [Trichonephila inaurata madagascariensis]
MLFAVFQGSVALRLCGDHRENGPLREPGGPDEATDQDLQEEPRGHGVRPQRGPAVHLRVPVAVQNQTVELQHRQRNQDLREGPQRW